MKLQDAHAVRNIPPQLWMELFEATTWLLAHHRMSEGSLPLISDTFEERVTAVREKIKDIQEAA